MTLLPRIYDAVIAESLAKHRQMVWATGPRQVGKTTTCRAHATDYLSWDNQDDRGTILEGPKAVAAQLGLDRLKRPRPVVVFDELHKHSRWRDFLKGFFDTYQDKAKILVTGSSRFDIFRRGGDSLMGRYFILRMHPFSVAELARSSLPSSPVAPPDRVRESDFQALVAHGGYPEPFIKRDARFTTRWRRQRLDLLLKHDVRELTQIQDLGQVEHLGVLLAERSASSLVSAHLANEVRVSIPTIQRWLGVFARLHLGFRVRPYFRNVTKALRKEPKWYLRDWSGIDHPGARAETFVACHLLKAVEAWEDLGLGAFELCYLRDKQQREVDFLVVKDRRPWFLVEVKTTDTAISPALEYFQQQTRAPHAFQVVLDLDYVDADCFDQHEPVVVPAKTFLSQLV